MANNVYIVPAQASLQFSGSVSSSVEFKAQADGTLHILGKDSNILATIGPESTDGIVFTSGSNTFNQVWISDSGSYSGLSSGLTGVLLEAQRTNYVLNAIPSSGWSVGSFSSITSSYATAPDGTTTSVLFNFQPVGNPTQQLSEGISISADVIPRTFTISFWQRNATVANGRTRVGGTALVDLNVYATNQTSTWQRITRTFTLPSGSNLTYLYLEQQQDHGNGSFEVWGVQLEEGPYASSLKLTNGASITRGSVISGATEISGSLVASGSILASDGTSALPSIAFSLDTDTGFYRPGGNEFGIVVGGTERWRLGTTSISAINSDGVKILNTGASSTVPSIMPWKDDSNTGIGANGSDVLYLITAGTSALTIDANQNITASGDFRVGNGSGNQAITINGSASSTATGELVFWGGGTGNPSANINFNSTTKALSFKTGNSASLATALTIDANQNITGSGNFRIANGSIRINHPTIPKLDFNANDVLQGEIRYENSNFTFQSRNGNDITLYADTGGAILLRNGNVGIGTTVPTSTLHVQGDGSTTGRLVLSGSAGNSLTMGMWSSANRIESVGQNIVFGTFGSNTISLNTNSSTALTIDANQNITGSGNLRTEGRITTTAGTNTGFIIDTQDTTAGGIIWDAQSDSLAARITYQFSTGTMYIGPAGNNGLGNIQLQTADSVTALTIDANQNITGSGDLLVNGTLNIDSTSDWAIFAEGNNAGWIRIGRPSFSMYMDIGVTSANVPTITASSGQISFANNNLNNIGTITTADQIVSGSVTISGSLIVLGETIEAQVTELSIEDKIITVASGSVNGAASDGAGLEVDRGSDANVSMSWDNSNGWFGFNSDLQVENPSGTTFLRVLSETDDAGIFLDSGRDGAVETSYIYLRDNNTTKWLVGKDSANDFIVFDQDRSFRQIKLENTGDLYLMGGGGNVGIGQGLTSLSAILHVSTSADIVGRFASSDPNAYIQINDATDSIYVGNNGAVGYIGGTAGTGGVSMEIDLTNGAVSTQGALTVDSIHTIDGANGVYRSTGDIYWIVDSDNNGGGNVFSWGRDGTTLGSSTTLMRLTNNGRLGIGTTNPASMLHISESTSARVALEYDSREWWFGTDSSPAGLHIHDVTAAAYRLTVDHSGNVGIGTTSPSSLLHLSGSGGSDYILTIVNAAAGGDYIKIIGDQDNTVFDLISGGTGGEGILRIYRDGTQYVQLSADAGVPSYIINDNFGIGTSTPENKVHVYAGQLDLAYGALQLQHDTYASGRYVATSYALGNNPPKAAIAFEASGASATNGLGQFVFYVDGTDDTNAVSTSDAVMRIHKDSVGIGTTLALAKLYVSDTRTDREAFRVDGVAGGAQIVATNGASYAESNVTLRGTTLVVTGSNVGIGTSDPGAKLEIADSALADIRLNDTGGSTNSKETGIQQNGGIFQIRAYNDSGTSKHLFVGGYNNTGDVSLSDSRVYISGSGNFGIGTTTPDYKLHVSSSGADGIKIQSSVSDARLSFVPDTSQASNILFFQDDGTTQDARIVAPEGAQTLRMEAGSTQIVEMTTGGVDVSGSFNQDGGVATFRYNTTSPVTIGREGGTANTSNPTYLGFTAQASGTGTHYVLGSMGFLPEQTWTATSSTRDSSFVVRPVLNGNEVEVMRILSDGSTTFSGSIHALVGLSGTTAVAGADALVVENSGDSGISILSPDADFSLIRLGSPSDSSGAIIGWTYNSLAFTLGTTTVGGTVSIKSSNNAEAIYIDSNQKVSVTSANFEVTGSGDANTLIETSAAGSTAFLELGSNSGTDSKMILGAVGDSDATTINGVSLAGQSYIRSVNSGRDLALLSARSIILAPTSQTMGISQNQVDVTGSLKVTASAAIGITSEVSAGYDGFRMIEDPASGASFLFGVERLSGGARIKLADNGGTTNTIIASVSTQDTYFNAGNSVIIGSSTDQTGYRLTVDGGLYVSSSTGGASVFKVEGTSGSLFEVVDSFDGVLMTVNDSSAVPIFIVSSSGQIGINQPNPTYDLDVNGTFRSTGTGSFDSGLTITSGRLSFPSSNTAVATNYIAVGQSAQPALEGAFRTFNGVTGGLYARNAGNTNSIPLIHLNTSDKVVLGENGTDVIVDTGDLTLNSGNLIVTGSLGISGVVTVGDTINLSTNGIVSWGTVRSEVNTPFLRGVSGRGAYLVADADNTQYAGLDSSGDFYTSGNATFAGTATISGTDQTLLVGPNSASDSFISLNARGYIGWDQSTSGITLQSQVISPIRFNISNTFGSGEVARFNTSGSLLIGTTSATSHGGEALRVDAGNIIAANFHRTSVGGTNLQFTNSDTGTTAGDGFLIGIDATESANFINYESTPILFYTAGIERFRVASDAYALGIGTTDVESWSSAVAAIEFGYSALVGDTGADGINMVSNAYYDGSWKYKSTSSAISTYLTTGGQVWRTAASGTADTAITWSEKMRLTNAGELLIGTGSAVGSETLTVHNGTVNVTTVFKSTDAGSYVSFLDDTTTDINTVNIGAVGDTFRVIAGGSSVFNVTSTSATVTGNHTISGSLNVSGSTRSNVNALGNIGVTASLDLSDADFVTATVTGSVLFEFSSPPAEGGGFILELTNGGSQTVTWPTAVKWPSGIAPTLTASGVDVLTFVTFDGGTTWRGVASQLDSQ